ncbi:MAG: hypothetical protein OEZ13_12065 [Spirochaetia bacterium]|nr:hypothetical protein [Spirochaetia bacterium]
MSTKKMLVLAFTVAFGALFMFAPTKNVEASKDLKKHHEKTLKKKQKCDDCHHKIDDKKKKKLTGEFAKMDDKKLKKQKKCTGCHPEGKDEIDKFDKLPKELKLVHEKCKKCHDKPEYNKDKAKAEERRKNLTKHLKKKSGCRLCHKGEGAAADGDDGDDDDK